MTEGLEVLVQEVMAAITTAPWRNCALVPLDFTLALRPASSAERPNPRSLTGAERALVKRLLHLRQAARGPAAAWARQGSAPPWPDPAPAHR